MFRKSVPLVILILGCMMGWAMTAPCPVASYPGSVFSGISTLMQIVSWPPLMGVSSQSTKLKTHNAIIILYLMHLRMYLRWRFLFMTSKASPLETFSSSLNQSGLIVLPLSLLSSEHNGPILLGFISDSLSWQKIETIWSQATTK